MQLLGSNLGAATKPLHLSPRTVPAWPGVSKGHRTMLPLAVSSERQQGQHVRHLSRVEYIAIRLELPRFRHRKKQRI